MKTSLRWFWERAEYLEGSETKLKLLKEFADEIVKEKFRNYKRLRKRFTKAKSKKEIINNTCFCCGNPAQARHHIIQLQNGGDNRARNIVMLCHKCHAEIHPWLDSTKKEETKETPSEPKIKANYKLDFEYIKVNVITDVVDAEGNTLKTSFIIYPNESEYELWERYKKQIVSKHGSICNELNHQYNLAADRLNAKKQGTNN